VLKGQFVIKFLFVIIFGKYHLDRSCEGWRSVLLLIFRARLLALRF